MKRIAMGGAGLDRLLLEAMTSLSESYAKITDPDQQTVPITNPYTRNTDFIPKGFICKGKHQYRQVLTEKDGATYSEWVCQCGRKMKN